VVRIDSPLSFLSNASLASATTCGLARLTPSCLLSRRNPEALENLFAELQLLIVTWDGTARIRWSH
jgi:hypothetical protein